MRRLLTLAALLTLTGTAAADVKKTPVDYQFDGVTLKGELYFDDALPGKLPGVLVVHEWWGLNDYARGRATELAKLGYAAFACDMYGDGKVTEHPSDATKMSGDVRKNIAVWQGRAKAALAAMAKQDKVDATKMAAIGYCFGGSTALQLASTGADLKAVATFHAALPAFTPEQAKAITAKVLVTHGADDKFISPESIEKFKAALAAAKVPLDFRDYAGAVHSFTVPDAGRHNNPGMVYNEKADKESWAAMKELFKATLGK